MLKLHLTSLSCLMLLAGCDTASKTENIDAITVIATGENYNWHFQYPGLDGVLGTDDDKRSIQTLFLPAGANITLRLNSNDYLYSFALPAIERKEIAVPGLDFELNFESGSARTIELIGDQFCGFSHDSLKGEVHIVDQRYGFYEQIAAPMKDKIAQANPTLRTRTL